MNKPGSFVIVGCVLFSLLVTSGCLSSGGVDPVAFNDALDKSLKRLFDARTEFDNGIFPALGGDPEDVAELKRSYAKAVQTVTEIRAETNALQVPSSKGALDFYNAFQRFLAYEERMIQTDFAEIVRLIEDPELNVIEKNARITQRFKQIERDEEAALAPVLTAQKAFAQEHHIKLK